MGDEKKGLSFGFSKKLSNKKLDDSKIKEHTKDSNETPDYILSLEDREVKR